MFGALGSTSDHNFMSGMWTHEVVRPRFLIHTFELKIVSHMYVQGGLCLQCFMPTCYVRGVATRTQT